MVNGRIAGVVLLAGAGYLAWREWSRAGGAEPIGDLADWLPELTLTEFDGEAFVPAAFASTPIWKGSDMPSGYTPDPYAGELNGKSISFQNNNPMNMRPGGGQWQGMTGIMDHPRVGQFVQFDTVENGYRAAAVTLINYRKVYGADTLTTIISKLAPPEDGNDPAAYIAKVSRETGIGADQKLDLLNDPVSLQKILAAITRVESGGYQPYRLETIQEGIRRAYKRFGKGV